MDVLIALHRRLQKAVDLYGMRPLAQRVFRRLYAQRYRKNQLARATQNAREWWLHPEVALRGEFQEFETIAWLREVVRPGMTVIDIGANVGQMTLEMAELVGPAGKVIAIEPAPGNVELLREHVRANGYCDRVEIVAAACGDIDGGELDFVVYGSAIDSVGSGHQLLSITKQTEFWQTAKLESQAMKVPLVTCDALCKRLDLTPHVLKIDVEGAEALVLQGARDVLAAYQPLVRMGFHPFAFEDPQATAKNISRWLGEVGYQQYDCCDPSHWELAEYVFGPMTRRSIVE